MLKKSIYMIICLALIGILIYSYTDYKRHNNYSDNNISEKKNNNVEEIIKKTDDKIPESWRDNGIFTEYYNLAYKKLSALSLEEKIGQIFLVRYPEENAVEILKQYSFGGYIFFEKDFTNKTKEQVISMINEVKKASNIPLITAVDEEGGSVVRISKNENLSPNKFRSPQELYNKGGFDLIKQDTIEKSNLLYELGINLNLAPVVDIAENKNNYIYKRTLGENAEKTAIYAKTVINASKGTNVSYCLKHFPGYGNNEDTHKTSSKDTRTYESIINSDIIPFREGIKEGAEAILVSHNIVTNIDSENPASLSSKIHEILRNELNFTGVIITDDLEMSAAKIPEATTKAILNGNDLIIVTDYENSIKEVKQAINEGKIDTEIIDKMAFKILAWKYFKCQMQ